jgi:PcfJ-like protein
MVHHKRTENRIHFRFDAQESVLYLEAQQNFGTTLRFLPWAKGLACERFSDKGGWVRDYSDPGIPLITLCNYQAFRETTDLSADGSTGQPPIELYVNLIPQIVRELAAPFIFRQIPLLQSFCAAPEAVELARSNPILLWLFVDKIAQEEADPAILRQVVSTNPMKILHTINPESDEVSLSFITRVFFPRYTETSMKTVWQCLTDRGLLDRLYTFRKIPGFVLEEALDKPRIRSTPTFLSLLGSASETESTQSLGRILAEGEHLIREIEIIGRNLRLGDGKEKVSNCSSMAQIRKLYRRREEIRDILRMGETLKVSTPTAKALDKMSVRAVSKMHDNLSTEARKNNRENYLKEAMKKYGTIIFPKEPITGNENIVPITDAAKLYDESLEMHHCVSSYLDSIMKEQCYIYSVTQPQRATLEIRFDKEPGRPPTNLVLGQLRLKRNILPSRETLSLVNIWFERATRES